MRRQQLVIVVLAGVAVVLACRGARLTRFDHRAHLAERACGGEGQPACLTCVSCHTGVASSRHDTFAPPGSAACASCHADADEKLRHAVRPATATTPPGKHIVFSHGRHLGLPELNGQCVKCHAGAVGFQSGPPLFPPMATCLGCHEHQQDFDRGACLGCHTVSDLRSLKPVSFMPHDQAWVRRHGDGARADGPTCALCHAQTQCDACHDATRRLGPAQLAPEAIDRTFVHRFDFVSRHAIEARAQPGSCATCHARTECEACHASRGVSGSVRGAASPHPPGWASGLTSNGHGLAARRDISSCAACHDQGAASNCVGCHQVGGVGGSPHPTWWRSTEPRSSPACAPCHGGAR